MLSFLDVRMEETNVCVVLCTSFPGLDWLESQKVTSTVTILWSV
jgi:hypothetical protein